MPKSKAERGRFTMANVVDGVARKLVYRHPHVFGDVQADTSQQVLANWDVLKRREKGQRSTRTRWRPCPTRCLPVAGGKIQSKTAKAGFDWTSSLQALDKLEAVIQHNQSDIRTWLPLEYEFAENLCGRGCERFSFSGTASRRNP